MVDAVGSVFASHIRVNQKKYSQDKSRQTDDPKQADVRQRQDYNAGKDSGRGASGCAKRAVVAVVLVFSIRGNVGDDYSQKVKYYKQDAASKPSKGVVKKPLHHSPEEVAALQLIAWTARETSW